jgi:SNF family Na+-dependent transporter
MLQGGIFVFQLVDHYGSAVSLMYIAFFETVSVVWFYGTDRLSANIKDMTGCYPPCFFRMCWKYVSPLLILVRIQT